MNYPRLEPECNLIRVTFYFLRGGVHCAAAMRGGRGCAVEARRAERAIGGGFRHDIPHAKGRVRPSRNRPPRPPGGGGGEGEGQEAPPGGGGGEGEGHEAPPGGGGEASRGANFPSRLDELRAAGLVSRGADRRRASPPSQ
eukprot:5373297-Pyramimonas_sp.AAC.1